MARAGLEMGGVPNKGTEWLDCPYETLGGGVPPVCQHEKLLA